MHNTINLIMSKGGTGALLSGVASKFGRTSNFLSNIGKTFPSTIKKITEPLQAVADKLNSYDSILEPFKEIYNKVKGYKKIVEECLELEDLEAEIITQDVISCVTSCTESCSNIAGNSCIRFSDLEDLIQL